MSSSFSLASVFPPISHPHFHSFIIDVMGPDSSVGIATRYGLDGPGSNPGGVEIFRTLPDRPWGPMGLLYNRYLVFPVGKAAGVWR